MTTEVNDNDPRVSDAYREVANETTPAELDRKVLAIAAAEVRAGRGMPRTWFRPLAWAATIALSFALVLEISQVQDTAVPLRDGDLAEAVENSPPPAAAAESPADEVRIRQQANKRSSDVPATTKATLAPARPEPAAGAAVNAPAPKSDSVADDFEHADMSLLREAEEQARMQSGPDRAVAAFAEKIEQPDSCDKDARASVDTWYACVTDMRVAGRTEAAQQELEALRAEFPKFREPPGDR